MAVEVDRTKCIPVLAGETCPNCGFAYGAFETHPMLPVTAGRCAKCRSIWNLDQVACNCGFVPTSAVDYHNLARAKNELRVVRGLVGLPEVPEPVDEAAAKAQVINIGRITGFVPPNHCVRCFRPWNLDALICLSCQYLPLASAELRNLVIGKNALRAARNLPPLAAPEQSAVPPAKIIMHPTEQDVRAARERDEPGLA